MLHEQPLRVVEPRPGPRDEEGVVVDEPLQRRTSVAEAVNADPALTPEQRASLLSVYRSFLAANPAAGAPSPPGNEGAAG